MRELAQKAIELGRLVLRFGQVERNTYHHDGARPETDTDHTVMLGIIACAYARERAPHLDLGKIAQFALVHDLVEAYAGDTVTIRALSPEAAADKTRREREALERIKQEFGDTYPWLHETIEAYESFDSPEARFVKTIDKAMPGITHALNEGVTIRKEELTHDAHDENQRACRERYAASFASDQEEALALFDEVTEIARQRIKYE